MKHLIEKLKTGEVRNYVLNTGWLLTEYFLRLLSGVTVGAFVARFLGPAQYGVYSYTLAFSALFLGFSKLGLDSLILKELVQGESEKDQVLGAAFYVKLIGGAVGVVSALLISFFLGKDNLTILYINIITLGAVFQSFDVVDFYFQSVSKIKFISYCKITQIIFSIAIKLVLIYLKANLLYFVIATLLDQIILTALYFYLARQSHINSFFRYFDIQRMKELLKVGYPLLITYLVVLIQGRVDQLILTHYFGTTELAYFSSAIRVVDVGMVMPVALSTTFYPYILSASKESKDYFKKRLRQYYGLMTGFAGILAAVIYVFSDNIIDALYGNQYIDASSLLAFLAPKLILSSLGIARNNILMSKGETRLITITAVVELFLSISLSLVLVKNYHAIGIIAASIISSVTAVFAMDVMYEKSRKSSPYFMYLNN